MTFNVQFNAGASRAALGFAKEALTEAGMQPLYTDIGAYMVEETKQRFLRGEAPDGSKWPAKSATTLERYKRMGYGNLNRPLIGPGKALSRQIVQVVSANGVLIGSNQIYAQVMQDGAAKGAFGSDKRGRPIPWGRIPARTWLGMSKANDAAIVDMAEEHVLRALGEGG